MPRSARVWFVWFQIAQPVRVPVEAAIGTEPFNRTYVPGGIVSNLTQNGNRYLIRFHQFLGIRRVWVAKQQEVFGDDLNGQLGVPMGCA